MNRCCLILCLFFQLNYVNAQETLLDISLSKEELTESAQHIVYGSNNDILVSIAYPGSVKKILLKDGKLRSFTQRVLPAREIAGQQNCLLKSDHENYYLKDIGGLLNGETAVECCLAEAQQGYYFIETDLNTGISHTTDTIILGEDEKFVTEFREKNELYIISYFSRSNRINFYVKEAGKPVALYEKSVSIKDAFPGDEERPKWISHFSDFFKADDQENYFVFDNLRYNNPVTGFARQKIYHFPGQLIFTVEDDNLSTYIVSFRLADLSFKISRVAPLSVNEPGKKKSSGSSNSFITDSLLLKSGAYNGSFFVNLYNINTEQSLYKHIVALGESDTSIASPLFSNFNFREQKKHKGPGLYKSFFKDRFSLTMNRVNDSLWAIDMVSKPLKTMNFGQVMISIAMSALATYGLNSIPHIMGGAFVYTYSLTDALRSSAVFNIHTGSFSADTTIAAKAAEKLQLKVSGVTEAMKKMHSRKNTIVPYESGGFIYLSSLDKEDRKFIIRRY